MVKAGIECLMWLWSQKNLFLKRSDNIVGLQVIQQKETAYEVYMLLKLLK